MTAEPDIQGQIAELIALGESLLASGKLQEAAQLFKGLRAVDPANFEVNKQLGIVLATQGDFRGAIAPLSDAVARRADDSLVWNVLSVCLFEAGDYPQALAAADAALALRRQFAAAHNNRGNALGRLDRHGEAVEAFEAALALEPDDPVVLVNLANVLRSLGRRPQALDRLDRALRLEARIPQAHVNRANLLQDLGRHEDALKSYAAALALDPNSVDARWNRSLCSLLTGHFEDGWREYEWRWRRNAPETAPRGLPQPLWLGQTPLEGKTILLHAEQGLGDAIQFIRYAALVAQRGARVIVEAPAPLAELFGAVEGVSQVIVRGAPLPPFDFQTPLMSLPLALGVFTPLAAAPYLATPPERMAVWRERLGPTDRLRVGLAARGSPTHGADRDRSIPLVQMIAAFPKGPDYHLLQKELVPADREAVASGGPRFWGEQIADFGDTAALAEQMDVVVSVDTAVAHLAGALGRPTRVLCAYDPDWRWGLTGETSPWYASVKIR
ncbi:MAG TPA: tetratricopeptide repeat-containing glycosyltransferase family protein, partial [Phenylobacterium sp.]|uniref:tetratricopeptide repeat-containing glycosyltransferase family protein n=1 Tax=Phenylobacterium sp. TaxID=1871053 RepID=UPI002D480371